MRSWAILKRRTALDHLTITALELLLCFWAYLWLVRTWLPIPFAAIFANILRGLMKAYDVPPSVYNYDMEALIAQLTVSIENQTIALCIDRLSVICLYALQANS